MVAVNRLLLIAGPSCSGKSTLIQRLCAGELPDVAARLRMGDPAAWQCLLPNDLTGFQGETLERVILHYDFLRPWIGGRTTDYGAEGPLQLAGTAAEVTLVTLWVSPEELHRRMAERRSAFISALLRGRPWDSETLRTSRRNIGPPPDRSRSLGKTWAIVRELRRLGGKVRSYRRRGEVEALYEAWVSFWATRHAEHWILGGHGELLPVAEWRQSCLSSSRR
jgi:hypothetical protein